MDQATESKPCFKAIPRATQQHKDVYKIGVLAIRGVDAAFKAYNSTFAQFLTQTAGQRFDPPISFEMINLNWQSMYEMTENNDIDFTFVNSAAATCLTAQYSTQSLATIVGSTTKDGKRYNMSKFGGLVITHADSTQINRIEDLEGKIVGTASISGFGSGLMQFFEMQKRGMSFINDPAQIVFTRNQNLVVRGVLDGTLDVGFVRTGQIEKSKDADGLPVDASKIKILESRIDQVDGIDFPFEHTTPLYPEWNIAATQPTPEDVSRAVQSALLSLHEHARTGQLIDACLLSNATEPCNDIHALDPIARCDTNLEVAMSASQALADGGYARWRTTLAYNTVRDVLQETGFIQANPETSAWQCQPPSNLYDQIVCPEGTNKVSEKRFAVSCAEEGYECPAGFECLCQPCVEPRTCGSTSFLIGEDCISVWSVYTSIFVPLFLFTTLFMFLFIKKRADRATRLWKIKSDELKFGNPPVVLGQGSFGFVLEAEFKGGKVAVKRAILKKGGKSKNSPQFDLNRRNYRRSNSSDSMMSTESSEHSMDLEAAESCNSSAAKSGTSNARSIDRLQSLDNLNLDDLEKSEGTQQRSSSLVKSGKSFMRRRLTNQKESFIKEMKTLSQLRHPNIITIMGAVLESGSAPMLVMEFMKYGSLAEVLQNPTFELEPQIVHHLLQDIAQGVRFLHSSSPQVIHGDLKSSNVLIDSTFRAKLSDFGFAKQNPTKATGTPLWMAPELLMGDSKKNTANSDMYSVGIIMAEILTRKEPYHDARETNRDLLLAIADRNKSKRPSIPRQFPKKVAQLLHFLWHHDPEQRPSATVLVNRLQELDTSVFAETQKVSLPAMSRRTKMRYLESNRSSRGAENLFRSSRNVLKQEEESAKHRKHDAELAFLYQAFPRHVANVLRAGGKVEPENHDCVTIFFSDIVGFTAIASKVKPIKVSQMLDRLYLKFDKLSGKHDIFKIETIGDAYMCASNLAKDQSADHVKRMAMFAMDAIQAASETLIDEEDPSMGHVRIRVGFHSGPVVSNVVGSLNPRFGIFGDTVNVASRMESNSKEGKVLCSRASAKLLASQEPKMRIETRGEIPIKGRGKMTTFWVTG